jgi:hypothetical protein
MACGTSSWGRVRSAFGMFFARDGSAFADAVGPYTLIERSENEGIY